MRKDRKDRWLALALCALAAWLTGCSSGSQQTASPPRGNNLFINGSFENGTQPWWYFDDRTYWAGFELSQKYAQDGQASAYLPLRADPHDTGTKIWGVIQEIQAPSPLKTMPLPKRLSGFYRVENWKRATQRQYLQFVVILWGDPDPAVKNQPNIQIRYLLAGVPTKPISISNARFLVLGPEEPAQGQWVSFERDLHKDFQELWGHVPSSVEKIRVLFEVRYDGKQAGEGPGQADVYFDNLYLGD